MFLLFTDGIFFPCCNFVYLVSFHVCSFACCLSYGCCFSVCSMSVVVVGGDVV
jgi:hypothetical protein